MTSEDDWIALDRRLPETGQTVEVRSRHDHNIYVVTFVARPAPRWERENVVFQFERFEWWRPVVETRAQQPTERVASPGI